MYICPTCNKTFETEESIAKHSLKCWKEHNPNHITKHVPQGPTVIKRTVNEDMMNFFNSF